MAKPGNSPDLASEALRKIGRNVVNFQKMEAMLKYLVSEASSQGPIQEVEAMRDAKRQASSRKSMGRLLEEFIATIYSESPRSGELPESQAGSQISFSFKVEDGEKYISEVRKAYGFIVTERNRLIHTMLADFDAGSPESCQSLIDCLDEQARSIHPVFQDLQELGINLYEGRRRLANAILSDEFRSKLIGGSNDA